MRMKKVLIVDDDESPRQFLVMLTKHYNCEHTEANDGHEALSIIDRGIIFDIVITDLEMPRMDGLELIKQIRSRNIQSKIIMSTGKAHLITQDDIKKYNIDIVFKKPHFDIEIFKNMVGNNG